jgi:hypothetical protein
MEAIQLILISHGATAMSNSNGQIDESFQQILELLDKTNKTPEKVEVLVHSALDDWNDPQRLYKSVHNAIFGRAGARALFNKRKAVQRFLANHGPCLFIAAAVEGDDRVLATDGQWLYLIARHSLGGKSVRFMRPTDIKAAIDRDDVPKFDLECAYERCKRQKS